MWENVPSGLPSEHFSRNPKNDKSLSAFPSAQQPGEGGGGSSHLPEEEPDGSLAEEKHELLQDAVRRGGIPHRPRGEAV